MRHFALLCGLLVGCASNTGDLPLGGPYSDAGPADTGAGAATGGSSSSLVFVVATTSGTGITTGLATITGTGVPSTGATGATGATGTGVVSTSGTTVATTATTTTGVEATSGMTTMSSVMTSTTSTSSSSTAPTWAYLYDTYLEAGSTIGDCDGSCHHHTQCSGPTACYNWIGQGQEGPLAPGGPGEGENLFSWDEGGFMPKDGPNVGSESQADADFAAWIAAGSLNDG